MFMPTFKEYREQAGLSLSELSRRANVDYKTAKKADDKRGAIQRIKAIALVKAISQSLGTPLTVEEIEGLSTH